VLDASGFRRPGRRVRTKAPGRSNRVAAKAGQGFFGMAGRGGVRYRRRRVGVEVWRRCRPGIERPLQAVEAGGSTAAAQVGVAALYGQAQFSAVTGMRTMWLRLLRQ